MKRSQHNNNFKRSHCQNFRQLFAKALLVSLLAILGALGLVACKVNAPKSEKGNSGGQTTSRPGDTPSVGDAGGADPITSTDEEIKAEIQIAIDQLKTNSFWSYSGSNIFHFLKMAHYTMKFAESVPDLSKSESEIWLFQANAAQLARVVQKDSLMRAYVSRLSDEYEILRKLKEQLDGLLDLAEFLEASPISYVMSECSPDLNHKVAAVSAHQKGARICFNLEELRKIPRNGLHYELIGILLHELSHLLGLREPEAQKVHNLSRNSWAVMSKFENYYLVADVNSSLRQFLFLLEQMRREQSSENPDLERIKVLRSEAGEVIARVRQPMSNLVLGTQSGVYNRHALQSSLMLTELGMYLIEGASFEDFLLPEGKDVTQVFCKTMSFYAQMPLYLFHPEIGDAIQKKGLALGLFETGVGAERASDYSEVCHGYIDEEEMKSLGVLRIKTTADIEKVQNLNLFSWEFDHDGQYP